MTTGLWHSCLVVAEIVKRHSCGSLSRGLFVSVLLATSPFPPAANAEIFRKGDVFTTENNNLYHYRADGMFVQTFDTTGGGALEGATITKGRKLITTRRGPTPGIYIFDADGNRVSFDTPQVSLPGDVSVFSDGTLAVSDQGDGVVLYSQADQYLGTISDPVITGVSSPFGSTVGPDDSLWIAMFSAGTARFSRDGTLLAAIDPSYEVQDLAVDPIDGTLWIPSPDGFLHHLTEDGSELSSFMTAATPPFLRGIAVAADQTLYVTSQNSTSMYHYKPSGELLDDFSLVSTRPLFISVALVPEPASWLLFLCGVWQIGVYLHFRSRGMHPIGIGSADLSN